MLIFERYVAGAMGENVGISMFCPKLKVGTYLALI
jgi:hypothetical protein